MPVNHRWLVICTLVGTRKVFLVGEDALVEGLVEVVEGGIHKSEWWRLAWEFANLQGILFSLLHLVVWWLQPSFIYCYCMGSVDSLPRLAELNHACWCVLYRKNKNVVHNLSVHGMKTSSIILILPFCWKLDSKVTEVWDGRWKPVSIGLPWGFQKVPCINECGNPWLWLWMCLHTKLCILSYH